MTEHPQGTQSLISGHYQAQLYGQLVWQILQSQYGNAAVKRDVELPLTDARNNRRQRLVADFRVIPSTGKDKPFLVEIITGRNSSIESDLIKYCARLSVIDPEYIERTGVNKLVLVLGADKKRQTRTAIAQAEKVLTEVGLKLEVWDARKVLSQGTKQLGKSLVGLGVEALQNALDMHSVNHAEARLRSIHKLLDVDTTSNGTSMANVIVVVADFCSFSQFVDASQLEPEIVAEMMSTFYLETSRIIKEHGGVLDKFMGDGLLAFFNLETIDRSGLIRMSSKLCAVAIRVANDWQDRIDRKVSPIGMSIGMAVGKVYFIEYDSDTGQMIEAIGQPINIAARLQGEADANELLAANRLKRQLDFDDTHLRESTANLKNMGEYQYWSLKIKPKR